MERRVRRLEALLMAGDSSTQFETHLDQRLSRLEAVVESLAGDVQRLVTRQGTNWGTLAAWAAVVISLIALGGSGYIRDLARVEQRSVRQAYIDDSLMQAMHAHELRDGHGPMLQRVSDLEQRMERADAHVVSQIEMLDTTLQREMRLLDDRIDARLSHEVSRLDEVLQREMRLLGDVLGERIKALDAREQARSGNAPRH